MTYPPSPPLVSRIRLSLEYQRLRINTARYHPKKQNGFFLATNQARHQCAPFRKHLAGMHGFNYFHVKKRTSVTAYLLLVRIFSQRSIEFEREIHNV